MCCISLMRSSIRALPAVVAMWSKKPYSNRFFRVEPVVAVVIARMVWGTLQQ